MILRIEGAINRYYVETLCMVFFPGATFSESEKPGPDVPEVEVSVTSCRGGIAATASIRIGDRLSRAEGFCEHREDKTPHGVLKSELEHEDVVCHQSAAEIHREDDERRKDLVDPQIRL